jgi:hypothetical protein
MLWPRSRRHLAEDSDLVLLDAGSEQIMSDAVHTTVDFRIRGHLGG